MEDKRLFRSAFHASSASSGAAGGLAGLPAVAPHPQPPWAARVEPHGATSVDPLQDLQRLLNRLITDVGDAGEPLQPRSRQRQRLGQDNQPEDRVWAVGIGSGTQWRQTEPQQEVLLRHRHERMRADRVQDFAARRSDGFVANHLADEAGHISGRSRTGDGGNYDHWFGDQKNSARPTNHWRYRSDIGRIDDESPISNSKELRRVPPSPSWPLNCPVHNDTTFKRQQQQRHQVPREIEITDLRSQQQSVGSGHLADSAAWWQTLQPTSGPARSDTSGGGSQRRAVSNRREATLRASAEQLDHLSRRDGTSGSFSALAAASASHHRSASDAAVRNYQNREDSQDYEAAPVTMSKAGTEKDSAWTREAEAAMSLWYQPKISREQAIAALRDAQPGSFLVRDSKTYPGAYGLALRVSRPPPITSKTLPPIQDPRDSLVRHFLIEVSSGGGVQLRGCSNEPVFRSLAELIQCHSVTPLALPCCLRLPKMASGMTKVQNTKIVSQHQQLRNRRLDDGTSGRRGTTCKVLYFCTTDVPESGQHWPPHKAVSAAVGNVSSNGGVGPRPIECRMRISSRGVKLSGLGWHTEFRLAYAAEDCVACDVDPAGRRFTDAMGVHRAASLFGLVVKKYGFYGDQNACLVLGGNLDCTAATIVDCVNRVCMRAPDNHRIRHH